MVKTNVSKIIRIRWKVTIVEGRKREQLICTPDINETSELFHTTIPKRRKDKRIFLLDFFPSIHAISFFFYLFPWFRGKGTKLLELLIDYFHRVCIYSRIKKKKERKKNVRARDYHSMQKIGGRQKVGASSWFLAVGQGSIAIPHSGLPGDLETRWKGEEKRRKRSAPSVTLVSISRNRVYRKETSPGRV